MAPGIPRFAALGADVRRAPGQPAVHGPGAEITVFRLQRDEPCDKGRDEFLQRFIVRHAPDLQGTRQIFAGKLARPGNHFAQRTAVTVAEHFEHGGIAERRDLKPLFADATQITLHAPVDLKPRAGNATARGRAGRFFRFRPPRLLNESRHRPRTGAAEQRCSQKFTARCEWNAHAFSFTVCGMHATKQTTLSQTHSRSWPAWIGTSSRKFGENFIGTPRILSARSHRKRRRAGGPPHSKTLARWPQSLEFPPGFGVRQSSG